MAAAASASSILDSAKPTWMSTHSPGTRRVVGEQADVDQPPDAADVHLGQVGLVRVKLDDLTGYAEAHVPPPLAVSSHSTW